MNKLQQLITRSKYKLELHLTERESGKAISLHDQLYFKLVRHKIDKSFQPRENPTKNVWRSLLSSTKNIEKLYVELTVV